MTDDDVDEWKWKLRPRDHVMVQFPLSKEPESGIVDDEWTGDSCFADYYAILCRRDRDGKRWWIYEAGLVSLIGKADGSPIDA